MKLFSCVLIPFSVSISEMNFTHYPIRDETALVLPRHRLTNAIFIFHDGDSSGERFKIIKEERSLQ